MTIIREVSLQEKHLVVFPSFFWGHARPLCTLVARAVKLRPQTKVTYLTFPSYHARVLAEIARDFQPEEAHLKDSIRVVSIEEDIEGEQTSGAPGAFKSAWGKLLECQGLTCAKTGESVGAVAVPPSAALIDFFAVDAYEMAREISGRTIPLYAWFAGSTNSALFLFGNDLRPVVEAEATHSGLPFHEVGYKMLGTVTGGVVRSSCMPSMYDYEFHPQEYCMTPKLAGVIVRIPSMLKTSDGLVTFDAADFQPEATARMRQLLEQTCRKAFYAGPLLPSGAQAASSETRNSSNGNEIMSFLDEMIKSRGERSVIYISFGSLFWPRDPAKIAAVIEVIIEYNIPFIMSHAATFKTPLSDDLLAKIAAYGHGIVSNWVPQQAVLHHLATGWYLSHGGHNSNLEAILAGVPMIVWPVDVDQPFNAIHLSETLDVAYELIEVRHGTGLGKIYRDGRVPVGTIDAVKEEARAILEKAFGEDGTAKRARLQPLRMKLQAAWSEDGIARREVEAFLDEL
ncbi:UDP-Glycosyltransferase/glycogen phosphorylase [Trametes meyenii]|nr:UDP-Glycosyltransferase/glycogen phosphorylase [Trametes meyenii]